MTKILNDERDISLLIRSNKKAN